MTNTRIDITDLPKHLVLRALFNASRQQGWGVLDTDGASQMTPEAAGKICRDLREAGRPLKFDYLLGRVLKVNISDHDFDPWLFDRDNGQGAAKRAIDAIRPG